MSKFIRTSAMVPNNKGGMASTEDALFYALIPADESKPQTETNNLVAELVLLLVERGVIDDGADMERLLTATDGATYEVVR